MCNTCAVQIKEMDIRDTDLHNLPFKMAKWKCAIPGCRGGCRVKDYGLAPYFYWPVKISNSAHGWRGGWFDASHHYMLCGRHWRQMVADEKLGVIHEPPTNDPEKLLKLVTHE